jgi:hypothetical protein
MKSILLKRALRQRFGVKKDVWVPVMLPIKNDWRGEY